MELTLATFALASLVIVMTPGPTVLLALSNGAYVGFTRSGYGIMGAILSDAVLITAAAIGLGAILATSAFWFTVVKYVGVLYLVWLGVQMIRSSGLSQASENTPNFGTPQTATTLFRKSFMVAAMNPKGYLFFTAFLPQFLSTSAPLFTQYVTLAVIFMVIDAAVMAAYAGLGSRAIRFLSESGAVWLNRSCGGLLIGLGATLAFFQRDSL